MKPSEKYVQVANFFARFASGSSFDFSSKALSDAFEVETLGIKHDTSNNGFVFGKKI